MLKQRLLTAILMLVVFSGLVFYAPERLWFAAIAALMAWAAAEWASMAQWGLWQKFAYVTSMPALLAVFWAVFLRNQGFLSLDKQVLIVFVGLFLACLVAGFWFLFVPVWLREGWRPQSGAVQAVTGAFILLPAGLCFLYVRQSPAQAWDLLSLLAVVWIADSCAYFAGRTFGRHKLAPSISPGKTWEGALGAVLGVALYLGALRYWAPEDGGMWVDALRSLSWVAVAVVTVVLTAQSIVGDLFESWIKRCAGVKDSGATLPGHGGILDRIDAILPTLPLQVMIVLLVSFLS